MEWAGLGKITKKHTVSHVSRRATPGLRGRELTQQKELFSGVLLMQLWPLVKQCSQFTTQQGGSQGNTEPKLTVLYLQIVRWCHPLAAPNWKAEARAPGCSSQGSASWSREQGEGGGQTWKGKWQTQHMLIIQSSVCPGPDLFSKG